MADENVQTTEQPKVESPEFDLSKFDFGWDENTGELITTKPEVKVEEKKVDESSSGEQQVPDKFVELETKFGNQFAVMQDMIAKQSNAISLLLQAQTQKAEPEESLGEEHDKLVETITNRVKQQIAPIQKQVSNQQIESQITSELQQLQMRFPDAMEYFPGMSYIQSTMPHHPWTANELYFLAKGMNLKQEKKVENKDNVTNINKNRELPNKVSSVNSELKSREIRPGKAGLKDALFAAMEELGYGT